MESDSGVDREAPTQPRPRKYTKALFGCFFFFLERFSQTVFGNKNTLLVPCEISFRKSLFSGEVHEKLILQPNGRLGVDD